MSFWLHSADGMRERTQRQFVDAPNDATCYLYLPRSHITQFIIYINSLADSGQLEYPVLWPRQICVGIIFVPLLSSYKNYSFIHVLRSCFDTHWKLVS